MVGMLSGGWPERREEHSAGLGKFRGESSWRSFSSHKDNAEDRPERTMPLRERQEIQEVLWRLSAADHAASRPGFDSGEANHRPRALRRRRCPAPRPRCRANEIRWYRTRGIIEPRAPRLNWTKPYRSMVFSVRDFCRGVNSAKSASDPGWIRR